MERKQRLAFLCLPLEKQDRYMQIFFKFEDDAKDYIDVDEKPLESELYNILRESRELYQSLQKEEK